MADPYERALESLLRVDGVRAAILVDADMGVPVVMEADAGVDADAAAALGAELFRRSARCADLAGAGSLRTLQLAAEDGHLLVAAAGGLLIVAVAAPDAQLAVLRVEAGRVAGSLA
ncbi:MAG TPA: roadblock/LC7 domain-containing protein [Longimicrobiales bacterium]|jgi:predicted regulator of Ras-like GTPase activity (Roadblock/LC7/MglB family)|nr:roadblock/LC7 domain-containing protein [Longimicrobiales bacterium]